MPTDVLIIGAGPAGLAAAIAAGHDGRSVTVLEKNDRPGRKLLLTGGGRCNLVDPGIAPVETLAEFGREGAFLRDALARFDFARFLRSLGVATKMDPADGHHYVVGGARKMLDAMLAAADNAGVRIVPSAKVKSLRRAADGFDVSAPSPLEGEGRGEGFAARKVILATGGITYPSTGSSGDAYAWAESLGHRIESPRPALAGVATEPHFPGLAGVTVADAALTLVVGGKKSGGRRGTILFTHGGISGPAAVDLSLDYARADVAHPPSGEASSLQFHQQQSHPRAGVPHQPQQQILIDFLPEASLKSVEAHLAKRGRHAASRALEGFAPAQQVPARLALEFVRAAGLLSSGPLDHASQKSLRALARSLKSTRLAVAGLEDPSAAVVTVGGVSTRDLDPRTMESRVAPGLFFAGELLSPAGPCGGFNLLLAFATGHLAGTAVTSDE